MTTSAPAPGVVRSLIPARIDRLPVVAVPHPDGDRARRRLDPRRARDHGRQRRRRRADPAGDPRPVARPRSGSSPPSTWRARSSARCSSGGCPTSSAAGTCSSSPWPSTWSAAALTALTLGNGAGWIGLPLPHPVHRRHGHRRRVRGDQLRHRRADPGPLPRPRRHRGQRHLLGRRDPRHAGHPASSSTRSTLSLGWRLGFLIGPVLGIVILFVRRHLPESPRWQVMHGREEEAEESIDYIEHEVRADRRHLPQGRREQGHRARAQPTKIGYLALTAGAVPRVPARGRSSAPR